MLLKAGAVSLMLLLASRALGLLRESALAAAFGSSGMGDVAVLMLTLPDWISGVLAAGALSYVLLPRWATEDPSAQARTQRKTATALLSAGAGMAVLLACFSEVVVAHLIPGLPLALVDPAVHALWFSAAAIPLALLAALWVTRLQFLQDFTGMYAANLVVNLALIAGLGTTAWAVRQHLSAAVWLGACLLLATGLRLLWLHAHLRVQHAQPAARPVGLSLTPSSALAPLWIWAMLAAALPMVLPFVARSLASSSGPGSLALFNYAWKLVELPLMLAIQLVASLSFPAIARAYLERATTAGESRYLELLRAAIALAWTLACAAAAALVLAAPALANLLFGWGRMDTEALNKVAVWGAVGAWSLLPQAVLAVGLSVLASQARMKVAVAAYGAAVLVQLGFGPLLAGNAMAQMWLLDAVLLAVAIWVTLALGRTFWRAMPLRSGAGGLLVLLVACVVAVSLPANLGTVEQLGLGLGAALLVCLVAWLSGPDLQQALRR